ncbi:MAG TPA: aminotransferase class V-fold PLP-dependent enzyme, partial [Actinomycetota bacterium]|nr:aminotransferase class V-fold PLP-dependent enzyme [Actinomycetota bacterium]
MASVVAAGAGTETGITSSVMADPHFQKPPDLMVAGPAQLHDEDLDIFGGQMRAHFGDEWMQIHDEALDNVRQILGGAEKPYLVPGSGTTALEMAVASIFEPGQRVVVADTGFFGNRLLEVAAALELEVTRIEVEVGKAIDPSQISDACEGASGV